MHSAEPRISDGMPLSGAAMISSSTVPADWTRSTALSRSPCAHSGRQINNRVKKAKPRFIQTTSRKYFGANLARADFLKIVLLCCRLRRVRGWLIWLQAQVEAGEALAAAKSAGSVIATHAKPRYYGPCPVSRA